MAAHIENEDREFMREHLKILGYLLLHTRRIDRIMKNSTRVEAMRAKMVADIDDVLLRSSSIHPRGNDV